MIDPTRKRLVLLAMLVQGLWLAGCGKEPTVESQTAEDKFREVADAFNGPMTADGGRHAGDIRRLFDDLGAALRAADHDAIRRHMDMRMMVQLLRKQDLIPSKMKEKSSQLADLLGKLLPPRFTDPTTGIAWTRCEIRKVRFVAAEDEAVVIVRNWDANGGTSKTRWWIYKDGDRWRAYDMEILEVSMRFSTLIGVGLTDGANASKADVQTLMSAVQMVAAGDTEAAGAAIRSVSDASLPPILAAMRNIMLAAVLIDQNKGEEALAAIKTAESMHPDMPMGHWFRAMAFNGLGRHEDALKSAALFIEHLGESADILVEIGDANLGLRKIAEATKAYRAGLKDDPQSIHNLLGLIRADPAGAPALAGDYRRIDGVKEMFPHLVDDMIERGQAAPVQALIDLHRGQHPDDPALKDADVKLRAMK